jgi:alpha-amylase
VFERAYRRAYEPMVAALERHPRIRVALHYTGPLLDWLAAERPEFLERLAALAARGQIEVVGGAYYEPILAALPDRDRLAQLRLMANRVEGLVGVRPSGAWLAERVWEPDAPSSLVDAGYRWTILDDTHFRAAAVDEARLFGAYTTDDRGRLLTILGTDRRLRYTIPFGRVEDVIGYLREQATETGERVAVMGDDGEKFGSWPKTYPHCWGRRRWVARFLDALERSPEIVTVSPTAWLAEHEPIGRVYIPTSSYFEMGEWALPPAESRAFEQIAVAAREAGRPWSRWLRGGFWRNFQARYREVNDLHKQMLRVSNKVAAMAAGPDRDLALDHLFGGQSNDCYWHGVFGGIYLAHLRLATLAHLIAAEDIADRTTRAAGRAVDGIIMADTDLDGVDEVLAMTPGQVVVIDVAEGAGIGSWDIRATRHALASVMRRRPEAYHARLHEAAANPAARPASEESAEGDAPTIHAVVRIRQPALADRLVYDEYERRSGLVHMLAANTTRDEFMAGAAVELGDAHTGHYAVESITARTVTLVHEAALPGVDVPAVVRIRKRFTIGRDRRVPDVGLSVGVDHVAGPAVEFELAVEWAINLLGGRNPAAYYRIGRRTMRHDSAGERRRLDRVVAGNHDLGLELTTVFSPATRVWWAPIETISNSEEGFEANCQGSALVTVWPMTLGPGEARVVTVVNRVTTTIDRTAQETGRGRRSGAADRARRIRQPATCASRADSAAPVGGGSRRGVFCSG